MKDKDDNQKFLEKFKDQITTMGKNGILDTNTNHNIKSNINSNINSKGRKGSAFLKPINKTKSKNNNDNNNNLITEPLKNNLVNNNDKEINNNNNINNPYIINNNKNNNNNISPILYYKYQNPYMYYNYNTNLYMNNNIQPNNIYPPYQLYYFPNNNQNLLNPYLIQNNYQNTENNKISNNPPNKKKLRPISAQNISNNNRSYLTNNNNNITNLTINNKSNMTNINRYEYKPYTLKDYKEIMNVDTLGGLGANIGTEEWNKKKEKMDKMSEYSKNIFRKTKTIKNKGNINNKKKEEISTRKRANEYSKLIRPKSSGHFHVNVVKRNNYGINNKLNVINNENIIQGKMALINAKKLKEKNNNINVNENNNIDKMKDIFDENQDETNDDKEMMEYYNKFKINENEILGEDNNKSNNNNNEDSLEIKKEEVNNNIDNNNSNISTIKKFRTFKEQRNAANNKNNINNIINKDNNINEEFNYNEEKEKEVNIESLFSEREKYLKEIENIKKGLQQK